MKKIKSAKQLIITLIVGFVPTAICFTVGWSIAGWVFFLLTLLGLCFTFVSRLYVLVFSLFAVVSISVICGMVIDRWGFGDMVGTLAGWRPVISWAIGLVVGIIVLVGFWFPVLYVNARWLMDSSRSLDVSTGQMIKFLISRIFQTGQQVIVVDDGPNGVSIFDNTRGILSGVGGPGILILSPGFAAVLQSGGRITRVVGPGIHKLNQFENFVQPRETKGLVDLRPQFAGGTKSPATEVRTKDGIPLEIVIGTFFQLEPTHVTDQRPESHLPGGDATTPVIGGPEYPVYEAIIRKALVKIPRGGFKTGWFPGDPITRLRDVVATYTLDEIFQVVDDDPNNPKTAADRRVIQRIEEEIKRRFNPSGGGVWFKGIDIREIRMKPEIEDQMLKRWVADKERRDRIADAQAEKLAIIERSRGQAQALQTLEKVKYSARKDMLDTIDSMLAILVKSGHEQMAVRIVSVIEELTRRVGEDETVRMRYIEAMEAIMQSDGTKSFMITSPAPAPSGSLPAAPAPTMQTMPTVPTVPTVQIVPGSGNKDKK